MLDEENDIEEHGQHRKQKLNDVEALVVVSKERLALEDSLDGRLHEGEEPAEEVEHDVGETPADGRLALPVQVDLRHVLDESDGRFHVAGHSDCSVLLVDARLEARLTDENGDHQQRDDDNEGDDPQVDRRLLAAVVHEDLRELHTGKRERMNTKDDVVNLDSSGFADIGRHQPLQVV